MSSIVSSGLTLLSAKAAAPSRPWRMTSYLPLDDFESVYPAPRGAQWERINHRAPPATAGRTQRLWLAGAAIGAVTVAAVITGAVLGTRPRSSAVHSTQILGTSSNAPWLLNATYAAPQNNTEPALPSGAQCTYAYATAPGSLLQSDGNVWATSVKQSAVGDSGLGASILALNTDAQLAAIMAERVTLDTDSPKYNVAFFTARGTHTITLDAALPMTEQKDCPAFLGYEPVNDVSGTPVFGVPLIEKAWAQFLSEHGNDTANNAAGYGALAGTSPSLVMSALTSFPVTEHTNGLDADTRAAFTQAVQACVSAMPCVLGTPDSNALKAGVLGAWNAAEQTVTTPSGTLHMLDDTLSILQFSNASSSSAHPYLVAGHVYAVMHNADTPPGMVTLRNPWGTNPKSAHSQVGGAPTIQIAAAALPQIFANVWRVACESVSGRGPCA